MVNKVQKLTPICPYCGNFSKMVGGKVIYPHRKDLYSKNFYHCECVNAYVGCHIGTEKPLGRLADAELRKAKSYAHSWFDKLWREKHMKRGEAYKWLAGELGIDKADCHIGMFDVDTCHKVANLSMRKVNEILGDQHG